MEKAFDRSQRTGFSPPKRGIALGWRLALSTVLIIGLVMGGVSTGQQFFELEEQRQLHQKLLAIALIPLADQLETAKTLEVMERAVKEFDTAYAKRGYPIHEIVLFDSANETVLATSILEDGESGIDYLQARIPINSPLLDGAKGSLIMSINSDEYQNAVRRDWWLWVAHFAVTLSVIFFFLAVTIYFQVTKPVNGLVRIVKKWK